MTSIRLYNLIFLSCQIKQNNFIKFDCWAVKTIVFFSWINLVASITNGENVIFNITVYDRSVNFLFQDYRRHSFILHPFYYSLKNVQFIAIKMFHLYEIEGDEGHEVMWFWRVNNKKTRTPLNHVNDWPASFIESNNI